MGEITLFPEISYTQAITIITFVVTPVWILWTQKNKLGEEIAYFVMCISSATAIFILAWNSGINDFHSLAKILAKHEKSTSTITIIFTVWQYYYIPFIYYVICLFIFFTMLFIVKLRQIIAGLEYLEFLNRK